MAQKYDLAVRGNNCQTAPGNAREWMERLAQFDNHLSAAGHSLESLVARMRGESGEGCDTGLGAPFSANVAGSPFGVDRGAPSGPPVNGAPRVGPLQSQCPQSIIGWLCWINYGLCNYNDFAKISTSMQQSAVVTVPDLTFDFELGPDAIPTGTYFPHEWIAEAAGHGIWKVLLSVSITIITPGGMSSTQIEKKLLEKTNLRFLQHGTQDHYHTALDFGAANQSTASELLPNMGGFFLGEPYVPYVLAPTVMTWDLIGEAPGDLGVDHYSFVATFTSHWRQVCRMN